MGADAPSIRFDPGTVPLLSFVLGVAGGIVVALFMDLSPGLAWGAFFALSAIAGGALAMRGGRRTVTGLVLLAVCAFAFARTEDYLGRAARRSLVNFAEGRRVVALTARVNAVSPRNRDRSRIELTAVRLLDSAGVSHETPLRIEWWVADSLARVFGPGDQILSTGRLIANERHMRGSMSALLSALATRGGGVWIPDGDGVTIQARGGPSWARFVEAARVEIRTRFDRAMTADGAALCRALVIGDQSEFGDTFTARLRLTGLSHIFALSGMNVAVVATLFWLVTCWLPRKARLVTVLLLLVFYLELGGSSASLARATIMLSLYMIGQLLSRRTGTANIILGAAFIELLWRPLDLLTPGFVLSYLAVAGVALLYPLLRDTVPRNLRERVPGWLRPILSLLLITVCAQLMTAPVAAYFFGAMPFVGTLGNLVAIPGFAILQLCAFLVLMLSGPLAWLGSAFAATGDLIATLLGMFVLALERLPYAGTAIGAVSIVETVFVEIALVTLLVSIALRRRTLVATVTLLLLCFVVWRPVWSSERSVCALTVIDVENGDALLIAAGGRAVLVDTGPRWGDWSAATRILPVLREQGVARLDALILTHPDNDHIGGAADLLRSGLVNRVMTNGDRSNSLSFALLDMAIADTRATRQALRAGDHLDVSAGVRLTVLSPDSLLVAMRERPNQAGVVLRLDAGAASALLTADIDSLIERELLMHDDRLDVDLLKVGHHGSGSSSSAEFLRACSPEIAVISVGRNNVYGHPHAAAVARLRAASPAVLTTGDEGTLRFASDGRSWRRMESRAERWSRRWHVAS